MIRWKKVEERDRYTYLEFELDKPIEPAELRQIEAPRINPTKGVVISGRGPIWLYCYLAHEYHFTSFVAVNDPRLGYVVTESHTPGIAPGDILS